MATEVTVLGTPYGENTENLIYIFNFLATEVTEKNNSK